MEIEKKTSIQHYLIKMVHQIISSLEDNSTEGASAVLLTLYDYKQAFSRQCHTLGVKSFIENGVRMSLIPLLIDYFKNRKMRVKWKGHLSDKRDLPGGGPQGSNLGNL